VGGTVVVVVVNVVVGVVVGAEGLGAEGLGADVVLLCLCKGSSSQYVLLVRSDTSA